MGVGGARLAEVAADEHGLPEGEGRGALERPARGGRRDDPQVASLEVREQLVRLDEGGDLLEDRPPLGHVAGLGGGAGGGVSLAWEGLGLVA